MNDDWGASSHASTLRPSLLPSLSPLLGRVGGGRARCAAAKAIATAARTLHRGSASLLRDASASACSFSLSSLSPTLARAHSLARSSARPRALRPPSPLTHAPLAGERAAATPRGRPLLHGRRGRARAARRARRRRRLHGLRRHRQGGDAPRDLIRNIIHTVASHTHMYLRIHRAV